jgi:hypothetical protein
MQKVVILIFMLSTFPCFAFEAGDLKVTKTLGANLFEVMNNLEKNFEKIFKEEVFKAEQELIKDHVDHVKMSIEDRAENVILQKKEDLEGEAEQEMAEIKGITDDQKKEILDQTNRQIIALRNSFKREVKGFKEDLEFYQKYKLSKEDTAIFFENNSFKFYGDKAILKSIKISPEIKDLTLAQYFAMIQALNPSLNMHEMCDTGLVENVDWDGHVKVLISLKNPSDFKTISGAYYMENIIHDDLSIEDIASTIELGLGKKEKENFELKYHKESKLLIMHGLEAQINKAEQFLGALPNGLEVVKTAKILRAK